MGHNKNWDRLYDPPRPEKALTLAEMRAAGWAVSAVCDRCRVALRVDLDQMVRALGPSEIIWGVRPRCRAVGCEGRVTFSARAVQKGSAVQMSRPPSKAAILAYADRLERRFHAPARYDPDDHF